MKKLKYTHPSSCGYNPNIVYGLDKLLKEMNIDKVKIMFEPINFKWEDLDRKKVKKEIKKTKEFSETMEIDRAD